MMKKKVTKDTTLLEILKIPGAEKILVKYNLPCLWCPIAKFEMENLSLGKICKMYDINLKELLEELNQNRERSGKK